MEKRGLIDKFAKRFISISRNEKEWENIKDEVLNTFDTDEEQRIFKISDISKYQDFAWRAVLLHRAQVYLELDARDKTSIDL